MVMIASHHVPQSTAKASYIVTCIPYAVLVVFLEGWLIALPQDIVLIGADGTACITGFTLSFASEFVGTSYLVSGVYGGLYFSDPDLVRRAYTSQDDVVYYPTKPCDIYSFGGVMLHVCAFVLLYGVMSDIPLIGAVWETTI